MKRVWVVLMAAVCLGCLFCVPALADEAGVLTESELGAWLNTLLLSTLHTLPLNAPVGEESLTEDGYAFLYETATLYYDKPVLDVQSVLYALAVTDSSLTLPRGLRLGAPAEMLMSAFGWQNPTLSGDATFAPLYTLNQLPQAAYWAWAQHVGGALQSVQCGIHARMGEDRYTDTGMLFTVTDGEISGIRLYGVNASVTLAEVLSNLTAVGGAPAEQTQAAGVTVLSTAEPFSQADLQFGRMDFLTLTEKGAEVLFGEPQSTAAVEDENGDWLRTLGYAGLSLVFEMDAQRQNARLESLSVTDAAFSGPRGLTVGMALTDVLRLFRSDGTGEIDGTAARLYGDGQTPPFATLERADGGAIVRYTATVAAPGGLRIQVALHLSFVAEKLTEIMMYRT